VLTKAISYRNCLRMLLLLGFKLLLGSLLRLGTCLFGHVWTRLLGPDRPYMHSHTTLSQYRSSTLALNVSEACYLSQLGSQLVQRLIAFHCSLLHRLRSTGFHIAQFHLRMLCEGCLRNTVSFMQAHIAATAPRPMYTSKHALPKQVDCATPYLRLSELGLQSACLLLARFQLDLKLVCKAAGPLRSKLVSRSKTSLRASGKGSGSSV